MKRGEVGVGDRVNGVGYDAVDVGGMDTEGGDTREHVTSSYEVLREKNPSERLPDVLWDGPPRLSLGGDDSHRLVGVFPLKVDTRGGRKEGVGDGNVLLVRGGRGSDRGYVGYAFVVDGGVGGWDTRGGTHCTRSWDRGGNNGELFKLLKSGRSQPKDKGLSMGTEGQELGGWEMHEGAHSTLGVGCSFFCTRWRKRGQGSERGGDRVLEFGGLFPNRGGSRGQDKNRSEGREMAEMRENRRGRGLVVNITV